LAEFAGLVLAAKGESWQMTTQWDQLKAAFSHDHKVMIRGYRDLLEALNRSDFAEAARLSRWLNRMGGPHIEFEECYLYPAVQRSRGEAYVARLYDEHHIVWCAIDALRALSGDDVPSLGQVMQWKQSLRAGLDHAATCGSLLSHLQAMPEDQQEAVMEAIARLRDRGRSWSEFDEARKSGEWMCE
jgi:hypothetical protein